MAVNPQVNKTKAEPVRFSQTILFEIFHDGIRKFFTENEEYIPDSEQLRRMAKLGYKFKKDGKAYKLPTSKTS